MTILIVDTTEFPELDGTELGRELELELTAIVTRVISEEGGSPSLVATLTVTRIDVCQTT